MLMRLLQSWMRRPAWLCWLVALLVLPCCQYAPSVGYAESAPLVQRREVLGAHVLALLPPEQRGELAARQEAQWLADTAYKASAAIARQYDPCLPGWLNNRLVNSRFDLQERGLCWHYANDLYRELRRRRLQYFRIGCCVRDQGRGSEHNCVFVAAAEGAWPQVWILDAWRYNGRLKLIGPQEVVEDEWQEDAICTNILARIYPECHLCPMEHWARVKSGRKWNEYVPSWTPDGSSSRQGMLMQYNMYQGMKARGGKLIDY